MNKQRKVLITITYNEMGIIIDTKAEELGSSAQPEIIPCDYVKACNEATNYKMISAVSYLEVLEELKKHGYVLVDTIKDSRKAAIEAIEKMQIPLMRSQSVNHQFVFEGLSRAWSAIQNLPPAQPEPFGAIKHAGSEHPLSDEEIIPRLRQIQEQIGGSYAIDRAIEVMTAQRAGKWIKKYWHTENTRECSACHVTQSVTVVGDKVMYKYCPYCGAKMEGANNESD